MQNKKDDTIFWSTGEDSDDDFEKLINSKQTDTITENINKENSVLSSENMDFMWSDDENEFILKKDEAEVTNVTKDKISKIKDIMEDKTKDEISKIIDNIEDERKDNFTNVIKDEISKIADNIEDEKKDNVKNKFRYYENYIIKDNLKNNESNTIEDLFENDNLTSLINNNKSEDVEINNFKESQIINEKKKNNQKNDVETDDIQNEPVIEKKLKNQKDLIFNVKKHDNIIKDENYTEKPKQKEETKDFVNNDLVKDTDNCSHSSKNFSDLFNNEDNKALDSSLIFGLKNLSIDEKEVSNNNDFDFLDDCNEEDEEFFFENFKLDRIENSQLIEENFSKEKSCKNIEENAQINNMNHGISGKFTVVKKVDPRNDIKENEIVQEQYNDLQKGNKIYQDEYNKLNIKSENIDKFDQIENTEDFFAIKPKIIFLNNKIFTYYTTKQKRYSKEGQSKEQDVNIFTSYTLSLPYEIKKFDILNTDEDKLYKNIKDLFLLNDIHGDSISKIIKAKDVIYSSKSHCETYQSGEINAAFNIANVNSKMAVDYCLNKKMWTLALILSQNNKEIVSNILNEFLDENYTNLVTGKNFIMKGNWINYFKHFINTTYSDNHEKYIREVYKSNFLDGMFVLVSFHLCKIINLKDYLNYFSHNPYFLEILIYVNDNSIKIENIDLLFYQHIIDIKDRNLNHAREFYKQKKKDFNKNLQSSLDEMFKLNWNFGIKDVLSFGINKILDVKEVQGNKNEVENKNSNLRKNILPKKTINYNKQKTVEQVKNLKITKVTKENDKQNEKTQLDSDQPKGNVIKKISNQNEKFKINVSRSNENNKQNISKLNETNEKNMTKFENNTKKFSDEPIEDTKEKINNQNENIKKSKDVYSEQKHSKSFADFFDSDKEEKVATTEDDTSLFLSKYNFEDDDKIGIKKPITKPEEENNSSFFNIFRLFKKKSYKIDLQATDDIKYDPVTKKWVTTSLSDLSNQSNNFVKSIPVPKSSIIPSIKKNISSPDISIKQSPTDIKKMSLYAGKKKSTMSGFNTFKKDNSQK